MTTVSLVELHSYLDSLLEPARYADYCPNGLQVAGRSEVVRLATGVTACQRLLDRAVEWQADAILVHHGYFWRGEDPCVVGIKRRRLATLLSHEVSLFAYHLPLDVHPVYGNNAQLGALLGVVVEGQRLPAEGDVPVWHGVLPKAVSGGDVAGKLAAVLGREPLHVAAERSVRRIAWCTGAAQGFIDAAVALGVDAYITGEASEQTVHIARENGIHFFAAGHHATERYGVQALGNHLAESMALEHRFFDVDNPV